jgi:hypothetical protein
VVRSVGVKLTAEVAAYKAGLTDAGQTTKKFGRDVDQTTRKASADFDEVTRHAKKLEGQIDATERAIRSLAKGFANTGDSNLLKEISAQQAQLTKLKNVQALLPDPKTFGKIGTEAGRSFTASLTETMAGMSGSVVPAIAATAVVAAPLIGATIAGAVVGVAGIGGVAGGLALAARDPRVKAAGKSLGADVMKDLEKRSKTFINPALQGIGQVRRGYQALGPDLDKLFGNSSKFVKPLVTGLVGGAQKIVRGVGVAVASAGPVVDQFGETFDELGGAVGNMFADMARDADEGASALGRVTDATVTLIDVTGGTIHVLSEAYGWYDKIDKKLNSSTGGLGIWEMSLGAFAPLVPLLEQVSGGHDDLRDAEIGSAGGANRMANAARGEHAALVTLSNQLKAQTDPVFALFDAQNNLAAAQENVTKATKKHGKDSTEAKEALRNLAKAAIGVEGAVGGLGDKFDGKMTPALRDTLRAAGLTKGQIAGLERQFTEAKNAGDLFAKTYRAEAIFTYKIRGERPRTGGFGINGGDFSGVGGNARGGVMTAMAAGGMMAPAVYPASNPPLVKFAEPETGGEAYVPKRGSRARAHETLSTAAGWYGMQVTPMARGGVVQTPARPMTTVAAAAPTVVNNWNITVPVSPLSNPAEVGRAVVGAVQAYEQRSGKAWRS